MAISAATSVAISLVLVRSFTRGVLSNAAAVRGTTKARKRRRYVVFEVEAVGELDEKQVEESIEEAFRKLFGDARYVSSGLKLIIYDAKLRRGVIRIYKDHMNELLASMASVRNIAGAQVMLIPLATSGSVRKAARRLKA